MLIIKPPVLTQWDSTFIDKTNNFKEELKLLPGVKGATTSWGVPGTELGRTFNVRRADAGDEEKFTMRHIGIDYDFMAVYSIKLLAGRNFTAWIIIPTLANSAIYLSTNPPPVLLGFRSPEDAIGKSIMRNTRKWDVVGVIADYHQKSLRYPWSRSCLCRHIVQTAAFR
jgi:putative ABC transport system permease protein